MDTLYPFSFDNRPNVEPAVHHTHQPAVDGGSHFDGSLLARQLDAVQNGRVRVLDKLLEAHEMVTAQQRNDQHSMVTVRA